MWRWGLALWKCFSVTRQLLITNDLLHTICDHGVKATEYRMDDAQTLTHRGFRVKVSVEVSVSGLKSYDLE